MISISAASSPEDFAVVDGFCRAQAEWDVIAVQPYGVSREEILAAFYTDTSSSLAAKFNTADARILLARWETSPAGCLAFCPFDDEAMEFHKFFVDPRFRGKGIGAALMRSALAEVTGGHRRKVLLHTTPYMKHAISIYESFGFTLCPRFRSTTDKLSPTDLFMSRVI